MHASSAMRDARCEGKHGRLGPWTARRGTARHVRARRPAPARPPKHAKQQQLCSASPRASPRRAPRPACPVEIPGPARCPAAQLARARGRGTGARPAPRNRTHARPDARPDAHRPAPGPGSGSSTGFGGHTSLAPPGPHTDKLLWLQAAWHTHAAPRCLLMPADVMHAASLLAASSEFFAAACLAAWLPGCLPACPFAHLVNLAPASPLPLPPHLGQVGYVYGICVCVSALALASRSTGVSLVSPVS